MDHKAKLAAAHEAFGPDKVAMLKTHLEAQIAVEFFTIPFYLTAVYSFTDDALAYSPDGSTDKPFFDLQQKALSVAVQEMYHLQEACNLANAFNVTPDLPVALRSFEGATDVPIPHLDPHGDPLVASLGNLPHAIEVMIEIESPDDSGTQPPPNASATYPSIGDLYGATLELICGFLTTFGDLAEGDVPHFIPDNKQVAYGAFPSRYKFNEVKQVPDVREAALAIVEQGEGPEPVPPTCSALSDGDDPVDPGADPTDVPVKYQSTGRFQKYDTKTHFARFEAIEAALPGLVGSVDFPVFYRPDGTPSKDLPTGAPDYQVAQNAVDTLWSYLLDTMVAGFQDGTLAKGETAKTFTTAMISFKYTLPLVWQHGRCPSFEYRSGVTHADVVRVLDVVDPLCLYHWDAATEAVRQAGHFNACQGLNACNGQGWGGIATEAGNGACATADFHTCQGGNSCSHQGGCGFLSTEPQNSKAKLPADQQWIPGQNVDAKTGGCQTPIATAQVFNSGADLGSVPGDTNPLKDLEGCPVWDQARTLLGFTPTDPPPKSEETGGVNYDGTKRREAVTATSTS